jgi:thioredoxin reductase
LEAVVAIAEVEGTVVTLSYRSEAFGRVKQQNRDRLEFLQAQGRVHVFLSSNVQEIMDDQVVIDQRGQKITLQNNSVIVCAGGVLPTAFLKGIGIKVETKYGQA